MTSAVRTFSCVVLVLVAGACAAAALRSLAWVECDETGYIPVAFLLTGALTVAGAILFAGTRLRWAILAAVGYGTAVYVVVGLAAIGKCTS